MDLKLSVRCLRDTGRLSRFFSPDSSLVDLAKVIDSRKPVQVIADHRPLSLHVEVHLPVSHSIVYAFSYAQNGSNLRASIVVRVSVELPANHVELTFKIAGPCA